MTLISSSDLLKPGTIARDLRTIPVEFNDYAADRIGTIEDVGRVVRMTAASTFYIPSLATLRGLGQGIVPVGSGFTVMRYGSGAVSIDVQAGVTLLNAPVTIAAQYGQVDLIRMDADVWMARVIEGYGGGASSSESSTFLDTSVPTIGGDFSFVRAGDDWAPDANGVWQNYPANTPMPAYENGVQVGFWNWPTRVNTSRRNINPTALTSVNLMSGAGSVAEVVSLDATQTTALTAAGLHLRCTGNVYKVTAGGSDVKINMSFGHGGDPDCALSAYCKTTDADAGYMFPSTDETYTKEITVTGDKFEWFTLENIQSADLVGAPAWALCVRAGKTIWFILNQVENSLTCTPPIHTTSSQGTRAASTLSIPNLDQKPYFGDGQAATILMEFTPRQFPIGVKYQPANQRLLWVSDAGNLNVMGLEHGYQREYLDMVSRVNNVVVLDNEGLKVGSFLNARRNVVSHSWANGHHYAWVENWKPRDQLGAIPTGMNVAYFFSGPTGDQGFSGIINRIEVYGSRLTAPAIAAKAVRTGRQMALLIGQSWMENWAGNQADRDPNPRRHFVETMKALQPWTEWDLLQGAKGSTSFDRQSSGQAELSFWYDHEFVPGTKGVPFVDCIWAVENALAQGHRIPIILHTNHTTTRSPAVYSTLLDGVYRYIYSFLQDMIEQKQGFKPKILMIPHSRRDDPASANPTTYQDNRLFNADLKAAFSGIGFDLAPEIYGAGAQHSDGLHWSTQMYFDYNPLIANKIHQMLGYSTGHGVDGPRITNVARVTTAVTVTVEHDLDGADFSNATTNDFQGFFAFNGDGSPVTVSSAERVNATTILVTLGATPTGAATFYYGYGEMRNVNPAKVPKDENGLALRYSGPWDIS